jgi:hypothetical protein
VTEQPAPWRRVAGSQGFLLAAVSLFAVGMMAGPFVTQMFPIDPASPRVWPLVRVLLTCGAPLLVGVHAGSSSSFGTGAGLGGAFLLVGLLGSYNAVADLARGPQRIEGTLDGITISGGPKRIFAEIRVRLPGGEPFVLEPSGWSANEVEAMVARASCRPGDRVEIVALEALDRVVSLRCQRPTPDESGGDEVGGR